jgi:hypothetical protein
MSFTDLYGDFYNQFHKGILITGSILPGLAACAPGINLGGNTGADRQ